MAVRTKSLLRREQYKELAKLSIDGKILDIGGSKKSGYHELIGGAHEIVTGNIDESYGTDLIFDAQERWPFEDDSFDAVLFVNLLEHLYRYDVAIAESLRVLKRGGKVVGVVPFMINVHGSPNDFFRYTKSALERELSDAGFTEIVVRAQGTGAFSVIYHCLLGFVRWYWMATPLVAFFKGLDRLVWWIKPHNRMSAEYMPLGYYFEAKKP